MEQLELFPDLRPMNREDWLKRLEQEAKMQDTKERDHGTTNFRGLRQEHQRKLKELMP
jgi:hypothetical protein